MAKPALALERAPTIQEIGGLGELRALEAGWRRLWNADPRASVFQSPEWLLPWCETLGAGARPWTLAFWNDAELVGLAPFFIHERQLTLMGNGVSDRLDVLCAPGWERELGEALIVRRREWDAFDFRDLPESSPLIDLPFGVLEDDEPSPVLNLPAELPKKLRQNLRTARHRAEGLGPVELRCATPHTLDADLDTLFHLHRARWRERGEDGALDGTEAFLRTVARAFLARSWLRLHLLHIAGRPVAAALCFSAKARTCYFIGGFDPHFADISPGALAIEAAVRTAEQEGCGVFDFLRGHEAYKRLWGARDQPQYRRRFQPEQSAQT